MKQKFIKTKSKETRKTFAKYRELLFKFWTKFAQLSAIFPDMNES
jgi:hypothetical protein